MTLRSNTIAVLALASLACSGPNLIGRRASSAPAPGPAAASPVVEVRPSDDSASVSPLARPGIVRVALIDHGGRPMDRSWSVSLASYPHAENDWWSTDEGGLALAFDSRGLEFASEEVPEGMYRAEATHISGARIASPCVRVESGSTRRIELRLTDAEFSRANSIRIVIGSEHEPPRQNAPAWMGRHNFLDLVHPPASRFLRLHGPVERTATLDLSSSKRPFGMWYEFNGLPAGEYTVELADPGRQHWEQTGVRPGTDLDIVTTGSASIDVRVLDARSGQPSVDWSATVHFPQLGSDPVATRWPVQSVDVDGRRRLCGLPAGRFWLVLDAPGLETDWECIEDLKPGERLTLDRTLTVGARISGRVLDSRGDHPAAGVAVVLIPKGMDTFAPILSKRVLLSEPHTRLPWVLTDDQGRFTFDPVHDPSQFRVRAAVPRSEEDFPDPWVVTELALGSVDQGGHETQLDLRLPPAGHLIGRLPQRVGKNNAGWLVFALPSARPRGSDGGISERGLEASVGADGRFEFRHLAAGHVDLVVCRDWDEHPGRSLGSIELAEDQTLEREFTYADPR